MKATFVRILPNNVEIRVPCHFENGIVCECELIDLDGLHNLTDLYVLLPDGSESRDFKRIEGTGYCPGNPDDDVDVVIAVANQDLLKRFLPTVIFKPSSSNICWFTISPDDFHKLMVKVRAAGYNPFALMTW